MMNTMKKPFNGHQQKYYERYAQARRVDLPRLINDRYNIEFTGNANNFDAVGHGFRLGINGSSGEKIWLANGTAIGDAVQAVQQLDKFCLNKETTKSEAIEAIEAFTKSHVASLTTMTSCNQLVSGSKVFQLTSSHRDTSGDIADYIKKRGISWSTFNKAQEAGFVDKTSVGVRFIGLDGNEVPRNAETRLLEPKIMGDKLTKFLCSPGSDRSYPPILPGGDHEVHVVEGGFSGLGLKEIMSRQGRSPTIIVSGGKDNASWLKHDHVKALIKDAVVTLHTENEKSPKIQAQANEAHEKQCQAILNAGALKVINQPPPAQFKDNADINLYFKQMQVQQQANQ